MKEKNLGLEYSGSSSKFLDKCEDLLYRRIVKRIDFLKENPFPSDSKFMRGRSEKIFRIRIGDYRIFYIVDYEKDLIYITDIKKRPNAYSREDVGKYGEKFLIKKCCCCSREMVIKVLSDKRYFGGNYFRGEDGEDELSWECDFCWNDMKYF